MKALGFHPLNDDIIDRILMFLPDFGTLQAAILSSKSMYLIFSAHPHSIIKAVASNLTGLAFLSAMNLVRYQRPADADYLWVHGHATTEPIEVGVITQEDARKLSESARIVNTFQDIYSSRHKDRSSPSSKLTPIESLRFTRAMYRIMLFADVFDSKYTIYIDDEDTEEEAEIRAARKDFFAMFPSPELCEILTVGNFIDALGIWLYRKVKPLFYVNNQHSTAVPPRVLLQAYEERNPFFVNQYFDDDTFAEANNLLIDYIKQPLEDVWADREEPSLMGESSCTKYILDHVEGNNDICQQCDTNAGIDLWTESNWEVQNDITHAFLRINMEDVSFELAYGYLVTAALTTPIHDVRAQDLIRDLFALKTPEYATWSAQDKLCEACLKHFMSQHIHLWLLPRKREAGERIPEDCWHGFPCRTEVWEHYCREDSHWVISVKDRAASIVSDSDEV
ncbi:hypothetical protein B0H19DRAFT_1227951 [Mycena capillaripes]|nr:hypothetical protein B0H19DRAFT_1227951 [Mycena capillaripes]